MKVSQKEALIVLGGSLLFFYLVKPLVIAAPKGVMEKPVDTQSAKLAVEAYKMAYNDRRTAAELLEMNEDLAKEYGIRVERRLDGEFIAVTAESGRVIPI